MLKIISRLKINQSKCYEFNESLVGVRATVTIRGRKKSSCTTHHILNTWNGHAEPLNIQYLYVCITPVVNIHNHNACIAGKKGQKDSHFCHSTGIYTVK